MNIQDALKETGKAEKGYSDAIYVKESEEGVLYWFGKKSGAEMNGVSFRNIMADDWQPYHPKEEIRPSEAGELWQYNGVEYVTMTESVSISDKLFMKSKYDHYCKIEGSIEIIHNQNGWKRLHPPVNDEEVIVSEEVTWHSEDGWVFPRRKTGTVFGFSQLLNKPPMTMTLTIPKEKS